MQVTGPGSLDCSLYRQPGRMIVHIQNFSGAQGVPPAEEILPVGPVTLRVRLDGSVSGRRVRTLVREVDLSVVRDGAWAEFVLPSIAEHEMVILE